MDKKEIQKRAAEVRDEYREGANTSAKVGGLMYDALTYLSDEVDKFRNFKGYYESLSALQSSITKPAVGNYAYVGPSYPGNVYRYTSSGWANTGAAGSIPAVNLAPYAKVVDLNATNDQVALKAAQADLETAQTKIVQLEQFPLVEIPIINKATMLDIKAPFENSLGAILENGKMVYTKKQGDSGQKTITFWLGRIGDISPSDFVGYNLRLINSKGNFSCTIMFYADNNIPQTNHYVGIVNTEFLCFQLPSSFISSATKIAIQFSVDTNNTPTGASISFDAFRVLNTSFASSLGSKYPDYANKSDLDSIKENVKTLSVNLGSVDEKTNTNKTTIEKVDSSKVIIDYAVLFDITNPLSRGNWTVENNTIAWRNKTTSTTSTAVVKLLDVADIKPGSYIGIKCTNKNNNFRFTAGIRWLLSNNIAATESSLGAIGGDTVLKVPSIPSIEGIKYAAIAINAISGLTVDDEFILYDVKVADYNFQSPKGKSLYTPSMYKELEVERNRIDNLSSGRIVYTKTRLFNISTPFTNSGFVVENGQFKHTYSNGAAADITYLLCLPKDISVTDRIMLQAENLTSSGKYAADVRFLNDKNIAMTSMSLGNLWTGNNNRLLTGLTIPDGAVKVAVNVKAIAGTVAGDSLTVSNIALTSRNYVNFDGILTLDPDIQAEITNDRFEKLESKPITDIAIVNKIEDVPTLNVAPKIVHCGNISMHPNRQLLPIINSRTAITDFDVIGKSNLVPKGLANLKYHNVGGHFLLHVGKSGLLYATGDYGFIYACKSFDDFISGDESKIVKISAKLAGIIGLREMDNGELVVITSTNENEWSGICVSTNWGTLSKTMGIATFVRKQTYSTTRNAPADAWGFNVIGNKILYSEYAVNSDVNTDRVNSHVYYSNDYGLTFKSIFNIYDNSKPNTTGSAHQHIHGCCIDPYWNRLWIMLGESAVDGKAIAYSDDEGVTWIQLSTNGLEKTLVGGGKMWMKYCACHALDTGVLMGTDSQPNGVWRYNRIKKDYPNNSVATCIEEAKRFNLKVTGHEQVGAEFSGHERTITHVMGHVTHMVGSNRGYPILVNCPLTGMYENVAQEDRSGLILASYDGVRFFEIWREKDPIYQHKEGFQNNDMKSYILPNGKVYIASVGSTRYAGKYTLIEGDICF